MVFFMSVTKISARYNVQLLTITLFELTEEHRISEQLIYNYVSVEATRHGLHIHI